MAAIATIDVTEEQRAAVRRLIRSAHESNKGLFNHIKTCITECEGSKKTKRRKAQRSTWKQKAEQGLSAAALHLVTAKASDLNSLSTAQEIVTYRTSAGARGRLLAKAIEETERDAFRASRNRRVLLLLVRHEVQVLMKTSDPANKHTAAKDRYAQETGLSIEQVRQYYQDGSKYEILLQDLGPGVIFTLGAGKTLWEERLSKEDVKSLNVPLFAEQARRWAGLAQNFIREEYRRQGGDPDELESSHTALARALWKTPDEQGSMAALVEAANAIQSAGDSILDQSQEDMFGIDWANDNDWLKWDCLNAPLLNVVQ